MKKETKRLIQVLIIVAIVGFFIGSFMSINAKAWYYSNFETTYDPSSAWTNDGNANDENSGTYAQEYTPNDNWLHVRMSSNSEGWITNKIILNCRFYNNGVFPARSQDALMVDIDIEQNGSWITICENQTFLWSFTHVYDLGEYYHVSEIRIRAYDSSPQMYFRVYRLECATPEWTGDFEDSVKPLEPLGSGSWKLCSHNNNSDLDYNELQFTNGTTIYNWSSADTNNIIEPHCYSWDYVNRVYLWNQNNLTNNEGFWIWFNDDSWYILEANNTGNASGTTSDNELTSFFFGLVIGTMGVVWYGGNKWR